ncbi:MAG: YqaJ viral recombinase family protein [Bacteroidota bacterium]
MKTLTLIQGTPEWLAHRASKRNASDAPAAMGCSPYTTRSQLLQFMHAGSRPDPTPEQQRRFDRGHEIEALKRPVAEAIIGEDLFPCVGSETVDGIELSASFDGLSMLQDTNWECKTLNDDLRAALPNPGPDGNDAKNLPKAYRVQMEQQCAVSGCQRVLFTASDGNSDDRHCWYYPDPALRAELVAAWRQFDQDLATYTPPAPEAVIVAEPVVTLPALSVQVDGAITIRDNLKTFGEQLTAFLERIDKAPNDDQGFANCESAVKTLKAAEDALDAAESSALAQTASIDEMRRTVATYRDQARNMRLALEKIVKQRKEQIKAEIVAAGKQALADHIAQLNARIGKPWMPTVACDFAAAAKNKRTLASLRDAVETALANAKIEASAVADKIQINANLLREAGYPFLFNDAATIVLKAPDDFAMLVKARIAEHEAAEQKRLEAERERIRAEEQARAEREARERLQREADERARAEAAANAGAARQDAGAQAGPPAGQPQITQAQPAKPTATVTPIPAKAKRPSDEEIVSALAEHFGVSKMVVIGWLSSMTLLVA